MKGRQHSNVAEHANPCGGFCPWFMRQTGLCSKDESSLTENSTVIVGSPYENLEVLDAEASGGQKKSILLET